MPAYVNWRLAERHSWLFSMAHKSGSILTVCLLMACLAPLFAQEPGTWNVIQERILTPSCAGCHVSGSSFATQSDLILTPDVAYDQLVGALPKNAAARADGLERVGTQGLPSLYRSYLWEKVDAPSQDHFYTDHPFYGALMPLGAPPLTTGELALIREWIIAGAPETGEVADAALLEDTSRFAIPDFAPLPRPDFGLQIHVQPFDVQPQFEREFFYYSPLHNTEDLFIKQVEIRMRPGSHHFIAYAFPPDTPDEVIPAINTIRDIRRLDGSYIIENLVATIFHTFVAGTQWPILNYHLPPGVALRMPANTGLDLNPHYVNRSDSVLQGEVYANLHFADPAQVVHEARMLNLGNYDINLPPQKVSVVTKTFVFGERRHIIQLFSHAHEHMTEFKAEIVGGPRDGELVYIAYDWEHPPILELDPPLILDPGQGLKLITTYDNWTDRTLQFGLRSDDEMMFMFGIYYLPSQTSVTTAAESHVPSQFGLDQNYPNPFNPITTIGYSLPESGHVKLAVYDLTGRQIALLTDAVKTAGHHTVNWDASRSPSGMYLVRLESAGGHFSRKVLLLR